MTKKRKGPVCYQCGGKFHFNLVGKHMGTYTVYRIKHGRIAISYEKHIVSTEENPAFCAEIHADDIREERANRAADELETLKSAEEATRNDGGVADAEES